ncbi:MAG: TRAP transporter substrate-binding protein [Tistlia sp.]
MTGYKVWFGAAAVGVLLAGAPAGAQSETVRIATTAPAGGADYIAVERFSERLSEQTDGAVEVKIFPSSQLGTYKEVLEQIRAGAVEGLYESMGVIGPWHPLAGLEAVAYLYKSEKHFFDVWRSDLGEDLLDAVAEESGFRVVGPAFRGFRQMTVNSKVEKVEDLDGMKIRAPAIPAYVTAWEALGARPTPIAFEEVYTAIQQGVVEGQENPIVVIYDHHFDEVCEYLILTNHMAETMGFIFNEEWYGEQSEEIREAIRTAARTSSDWYREFTRESETKMLDELEAKGMEVIEPDLSGFMARAATAEIDPAIAPWVEKIRARD